MSADGCWSCWAARAHLPPCLCPPFGLLNVDKRSTSSCQGLFCLQGLLTDMGSADFLSCKMFVEGRLKSPGDGWCPPSRFLSALVLLCILLQARWGRGRE